MDAIKACKDCKWCSSLFKENKRRCTHEAAEVSAEDKTDWYRGRLGVEHLSIDTMRMVGKCGKDAKLFEEKGI